MTTVNHGKENAEQVIKALEEARAQNPELASFYEFHQQVLQLQHQAKAQIAATLEMVDEQALQSRLQQGLPLLSFAQLPIEEGRFANQVGKMVQVLTDYDPDLEAQAAPGNADECLTLARQRFEQAQVVEGPSTEQDQITLAQFAVDLALQPYLEWAAEQMLPYVNHEEWKQGYCPICGAPPDLATLDEKVGTRHLLCSRCNSQWLYRRIGCPFCGVTDHTRLVYYPGEDEVYRLYVCQECRRYLKAIDLRKATKKVLLPAERVTTVAMDAAAREEGYW